MLDPRDLHRQPDHRIFAGLDIGTSKIGVVIGQLSEDDKLCILGVGMSPSKGLRQGVVINLDQAVQSIDRAVQEAQLTAGVKVQDFVVGIAGDHIRSINSRGVVAVAGKDKEIDQSDVDRVLEAARAINLPPDRELLHVLPQEFIVDNQGGIKNPIGISGVRLEAEVHIVTGAVTSANNILRSVSKAGYHVSQLVLEPIASHYAVLDENEKELGVALIDLGGGTTDIALFHEGVIRNTAVIGLGSQNVTNDIALGLRTPIEQAEMIKCRYGSCLAPESRDDDTFMVPGIGGREPREVSRTLLTSIIQPRMEEIFSLAAKEIKRSEYGEKLGAGIVLTGGGALLKNAAELAEEIFGVPVKVGAPHVLQGLIESASSPVFSTGVGLVLYGIEHENDEQLRVAGRKGGFLKTFFNSLRSVAEDFFQG
ncbi:cell division protein FtsA [bacterium]|nr:cell division protein FtsA [bacterium]